MEAGGAGADGYGVGHGVIGGERGFKGGKFGAERQVRGAKDGGDGVDFGLGDVGGGERNGHGRLKSMVSHPSRDEAARWMGHSRFQAIGVGCLINRPSKGTVVRTRAMVWAAVPLP